MVRVLFAASIGVLLGGIVVMIVAGEGAGVWIMTVGSLLTALFFVVLMLAAAMRSSQIVDPALLNESIEAGRLGIARVDSLQQTRTEINDQPVCIITLTVQPRNGEAFRTKLKRIVSLTEIPRFQPGSRIVTAILVEGGTDLAFTDESPAAPEWASFAVPPAGSAGPILEQQEGIPGVGGKRAKPLLSNRREGRGARFVLYIVVAMLAAAAVVLPHREAFVETVEAIPQGRFSADLRQPEYLERGLAKLSEKLGHDQVISVYVSADYLVVDAPIEAGKLPTDSWRYSKGSWERQGAKLIQPKFVEEQFAVSDVDWGAFWPGLLEAKKQTELESLDGATLSVARGTKTTSSDHGTVTETTPPSVYIGMGDDYSSYSFRMNGDGSGLVMQ